MSFDAPWVLVAGAIAAFVLTLLFRRAEARTDAQTLRYSSLPFLESAIRPRRWPILLFRAAWIVAIAASSFPRRYCDNAKFIRVGTCRGVNFNICEAA